MFTSTCLVLLVGISSNPNSLMVQDAFGRPLDRRGVVLVDWEGHIANPLIPFAVVPPPDAKYPVQIEITTEEPRLYFDMPSTTSMRGSKKLLSLNDKQESTYIGLSVFPDRDCLNEKYLINILSIDAGERRHSLTVPVLVIDQDKNRRPDFAITVDFSQDKTGFFLDDVKRAIVSEAADDWAYYFLGAGLDTTPAGAEVTPIWNPDGFLETQRVINSQAYTGFLLYVYGIDSPLLRSGGDSSPVCGFLSYSGKTTALRRSGGYAAEVKGNYNRKGWLVRLQDRDWWQATNLEAEQTDLYSIAHHEIGHALVFSVSNTAFSKAKETGSIRNEKLKSYLSYFPTIDQDNHLDGIIDPASQHGCFGNEYCGTVPNGRWLITKADLLTAQAIGFKLRDTSAFTPLSLSSKSPPSGRIGEPYTMIFRADGGLPYYDWTVLNGSLPTGLSLDQYTGELKGIPKQAGKFGFTVQVREPGHQGQSISHYYLITISMK